jgi:hypothetical protein
VTARTALDLADAEARLASRFAPDCPQEAARLLVHAAWIYRANGKEQAAQVCEAKAAEMRGPRVRHRPGLAAGGAR